MPSPSVLEQWATKLYDDVARNLACPEYCLDDENVRLQAELDIDEAQRSIPIVRQLLQDDIDASTAAAAFAAICEARLLDVNGNKTTPSGLWEVVCNAIQHFAHDEAGSCAKLANMMFEFSKIEVRKDNGDVVRTPRGRFWRDLPSWHLYFGEHMIDLRPLESYTDRSEYMSAWSRRLQNGSLFQAYWLVHIGTEGARGEYLMATGVALRILHSTLEVNPEDSPRGLRRTEHHLLAAVHWIFEAGATVLQLCRDEYKRDGTPVFCTPIMDRGIVGYSYHGDDGFHMERWGFWKAAFQRVAATEGIEPDVASKATAAAEEMDRLERSGLASLSNGGS